MNRIADSTYISEPNCFARGFTTGRFINGDKVCRLPDPEWMLDHDEPFLKRRDRLPEPAQSPKSISAWELIKEFVGKDLAKVCSGYCSALHLLCCLNFHTSSKKISVLASVTHKHATVSDIAAATDCRSQICLYLWRYASR